VKNVIGGACYVGGFNTIKLSPESNWYHMHVEVSRTLHAFEFGEMYHTWICDLVYMCIGEIRWMLWRCEFVDLVMFIDILWWWCANIHVEYFRNVEYVDVYLFNTLNYLFNYVCFLEYYLTPSGRSVDNRVISLNGVGDLQDWGDCFSLMLED
jgi:hypothetical protein